MDAETPKKKSDLPVRFASAVVMLTVAGIALWLGGAWFDLFALIVAVLCVSEFGRLVMVAFEGKGARLIALLLGGAYVALATYALVNADRNAIAMLVGAVIAVDVGAYFVGRSLGGPKIAPSISPSKTWAGLVGGILGVFAFVNLYGVIGPKLCQIFVEAEDWRLGRYQSDGITNDGTSFGLWDHRCHWGGLPELGDIPLVLAFSVLIAVVAQSGDFFESWLKRRAGVKDSSKLIPGHGGVFDRVDGLLAVAFVVGILMIIGGRVSL